MSGPGRRRPKSLAISTPTKLISLEEAREQIFSMHTPSSPRQKYIEVGGGPEQLPKDYHTVIDLPHKYVHWSHLSRKLEKIYTYLIYSYLHYFVQF